MPDITMCKGGDCKQKDKCYRYTAKPCEYRQSYFVEVPKKPEDNECKYFYGTVDA
jgi:hypothetical protein